MKRSVLISGFFLAVMISGCSAPQTVTPAPQTQPDDAARRDRDRDKDRERERDQNRPPDEHRDADRDHRQASCPDGQHLSTDPDGRTRCVNN
jgi:hypothetical protein